MYKYEIAFKNKEAAFQTMWILVEEEYVAMISREEDLYVVNYEYAPDANRNNVVFMDREAFDFNYIHCDSDAPDPWEGDN